MKRQARSDDWTTSFDGMANGLVALFGPLIEVAAHDIETDRIVRLWGATSNRSVGEPALLADLPEYGPNDQIIGPYEKWSVTGARIVSVSIIVRRDAEPIGMLCINFDRTPLETASALLNSFVVPTTERPIELFERDWREQIALTAQRVCQENAIDRTRMTRNDRLKVVKAINDAGLFATRNAASVVATAIGASRATVYSLLKEVRGE